MNSVARIAAVLPVLASGLLGGLSQSATGQARPKVLVVNGGNHSGKPLDISPALSLNVGPLTKITEPSTNPDGSLFTVRSIGNPRLYQSAVSSADASTLAMITGSNRVDIYRVSDSKLLRSLTGLPATPAVGSLSLSFDGQLLAVTNGQQLFLIRTADGAMLQTTAFATQVLFAPNSTVLFTIEGGTISLRRTSDLSLLNTLTGNASSVSGMAVSPDGQRIAGFSNSGNNAISEWNIASGLFLRAYTPLGASTQVTGLAYSPDSQKITAIGKVTGSSLVQSWNVGDGTVLLANWLWQTDLFSLAYAFDGGAIITEASLNMAPRNPLYLDASTGQVVFFYGSTIQGLAVSQDFGRISYGISEAFFPSRNRTAVKMAPFNFSPTDMPPVANGNIGPSAFSPDNSQLAIGGSSISLYGLPALNLIRSFASGSNPISDLQYTANGQFLGVMTNNGTTYQMWRVADGRLLWTTSADPTVGFQGYTCGGASVLLVTLERGKYYLNSYRILDRGRLNRFEIPSGATFSRDGNLMALTVNKQVRIARTGDGSVINSFSIAPSSSAVLSPDGRYVYSVDNNLGVLRLWTAADGVQVALYDREVFLNSPLFIFSSSNRYFYTRPDGAMIMAQLCPLTQMSMSSASALVGQTVPLQVLVRNKQDGSPLVGKTVSFYLGQDPNAQAMAVGPEIGSAITDASGVATLNYTIPRQDITPFTYALLAQYLGDDGFEPNAVQATLTVTERTGLTTTNVSAPAGQRVFLRSILRRAGGTPLPNRTLTYSVGGTVLGTAQTDASGQAIFRYVLPTTATGTLTYTVDFTGDQNYLPSNATGTITVTP